LTMKAAVITAQASAGTPVAPVVKIVPDFPDPPPPGPREVQVRTLCSALNHLDLWVGKGVPGLALTYPRIGGGDAGGGAEGAGPGGGARRGRYGRLDPPEPGVSDLSMIGEHVNGTHAQFFNAPVSNVQAVRDDADPAEAAAYGLTFLTAYSMMLGK